VTLDSDDSIENQEPGHRPGPDVEPAPVPPDREIGSVTAISGFKLSCLFHATAAGNDSPNAYAAAQIGGLIKIHTPRSTVFGFIGSLTLQNPTGEATFAVAEIVCFPGSRNTSSWSQERGCRFPSLAMSRKYSCARAERR